MQEQAVHRLEDHRQTTGRCGPQELAPAERLRFAMSVLQYNQSFVNVTDGKANSLLLINSIFLASGAAGDLASPLALGAALLAAAAIVTCLAVVYARLPSGPATRDRVRLVFFDHIRRWRNREDFQHAFCRIQPGLVADGLAAQLHELAGVVHRKFRAYRTAQVATAFSAALWIANLMAPALQALQISRTT